MLPVSTRDVEREGEREAARKPFDRVRKSVSGCLDSPLPPEREPARKPFEHKLPAKDKGRGKKSIQSSGNASEDENLVGEQGEVGEGEVSSYELGQGEVGEGRVPHEKERSERGKKEKGRGKKARADDTGDSDSHQDKGDREREREGGRERGTETSRRLRH